MQKVCAVCSAALDHDATFCAACSAPISAPSTIVCPQCGKSVGAGSKFCKYCAFSLADAAVRQSLPHGARTGGVPFDTPQPPAAFNTASTSNVQSPFDPPSHGGPPPAFDVQPPSPYVPSASVEASAFGVQPSQFGLPAQPAPAAPYGAPTATQEATAAEVAADKGSLITPSGAAIVVICFFLPWVQFSCGGYTRSVTGIDMASRGESSLWVVPCAAAVIIGAYFFFKAQRRTAKSRPLVIVGALVGLAVMVYKAYQFTAGEQTIFGRITPRDIGLSPQLGALGTFLGFFLSLFGAATMRVTPARTGGAGVPLAPVAPRAPLRENMAGALCYAAVPVFLVLWVLGLPLLAIPLSYVLWIAAPLALLLVAPHKANPFVRVHAFQSALMSAAFFLVTFFRVLLVPGLNLEEYAPFYTVSDGLWQLLFAALLGGMIFLMYSAYKGRPVTVPSLTNFATKLAAKGQRGPSGMR